MAETCSSSGRTADYRYRVDSTGTEVYGNANMISEIRENDPGSAQLQMNRSIGLQRPGWDTRVESRIQFSMTKDTFLLVGEIRAFDDGKPFFSRKWTRPIRRQLV